MRVPPARAGPGTRGGLVDAGRMMYIERPSPFDGSRMKPVLARWPHPWWLVLAAALCACATGAGPGQQGGYLYRSDDQYVRLVPIEPGAPRNAHPFEITGDQLSRLLSSVGVSRATSIDEKRVFTFEELDTIVPPLVEALSRAAPDQDVVFAVAGHQGMFGRLSPESITTGRLFVRDDALNLIFGLMQARLDIGELNNTGVRPKVVPGSRAHDAGNDVWELDPGLGRLNGERGDWVVFERSAIPAPAAAPARAPARERQVQPERTTPARVDEIERRLRVLDELRERGAITDEEYLERRQAILREL